MKHSIRRYGQLEQLDCEVGTDILDINGREILEGDIVRSSRTGTVRTVSFFDGRFSAGSISLKYDDVEIIGHSEE